MSDNKKTFIIANWKMKIIDFKTAKQVFVAERKVAARAQDVQTIICPPAMYLEPLSKLVSGHRCVLGAQNVFYEESGAFTGELSPKMLNDRGISYSIVGHSERRALGETDEDVSRKIRTCLKNSVIPILCIGERERDTKGKYYDVLKKQIHGSVEGIPKTAIGGIIFAYEPVWAISSSKDHKDATPADSREAVLFIKKVLSDLCGKKLADTVTILYGGSVDKENTRDFLSEGGVDGLLVGGASVDAKNFGSISKIADKLAKK